MRVNNTLNPFEVYGNGKLQATHPVDSGRTGGMGVLRFTLQKELKRLEGKDSSFMVGSCQVLLAV